LPPNGNDPASNDPIFASASSGFWVDDFQGRRDKTIREDEQRRWWCNIRWKSVFYGPGGVLDGLVNSRWRLKKLTSADPSGKVNAILKMWANSEKVKILD